jgi:hypothetical protein
MKLQDATTEFMQRVAIRAYENPLDIIQKLLRNGPAGTIPRVEDVELHKWYQDLSEENKAMVERVMKETAHHVLFGFLVIIDNLTMGYPIEGEVSDFALYIQAYSDKVSRSNNEPKETIRINHPKNNFSLHDLLSEYIK